MKSRILSTVLVLLFITACNSTFEVGLEHSPNDNTSLISNTTTPLASNLIPLASTDPQPSTAVQDSTGIQVSAETLTSQMVKIFMIAVDDNGQTGTQIGCGDSVVPVEVEIQPTQGILRAALEALLLVKDQYYGQSGLYNALYQSNLEVESVSINGGKANVYLTGNLVMGGECDTPRVQAQLEQTILQFPSVTQAAIFINGQPLADVLSLKGIDPQPSSTNQTPTQNMVKIFLIALDDNGMTGTQVGCGDSVVPVEVEIQPTQGILKAALVALLSVKDQYYGQSGLYNALYQSDLQVESVSIKSGKASVYLTGTLLVEGECDSPRVQVQLERTVLQFTNVIDVALFINGQPLADVLSLKG